MGDLRTLATGVQCPGFDSTWNNRGDYTDHREVPGRKYNSVRVANSTALRTRSSDMIRPESTDVRNDMPASHKKDMGAKGSMVVSMALLKMLLFSQQKHQSGWKKKHIRIQWHF